MTIGVPALVSWVVLLAVFIALSPPGIARLDFAEDDYICGRPGTE
jgi:hypothetical protein